MPELSNDLDLKFPYAKKTSAVALILTVGTERQLHKTQRATNPFL